MQKRQSDQRETKQVRIDAGLHKLLKIKAAKSNTSIREVLEERLEDWPEIYENDEKT